jgi:hypothetical protein
MGTMTNMPNEDGCISCHCSWAKRLCFQVCARMGCIAVEMHLLADSFPRRPSLLVDHVRPLLGLLGSALRSLGNTGWAGARRGGGGQVDATGCHVPDELISMPPLLHLEAMHGDAGTGMDWDTRTSNAFPAATAASSLPLSRVCCASASFASSAAFLENASL